MQYMLYMVYSIVLFPFLIKHYSIFNKKFLLYGLHINQSRHTFKKICGGAIVLKTKIGAVLLIILATLGFSETMAAQHAEEEEHTRRKTHGPPRTNTHRIYVEKRHKPKTSKLDCFQCKRNAIKA